MITSFEVGSIFRIVDEASPALRVILREVRALNAQLDQARASLTSLGKFAMPTGLTAAVGETAALAKAWSDVAANAVIAQRAIGAASTAAVRSAPAAAAAATSAARTALPAAAAAATGGGSGAGRPTGGGGGGAHRPGGLSGGAHIYGPGFSMPGGTHVRMGGGRMGGGATGAMVGAGLLGYGVYEAAQMEDAVFQMIFHARMEQNDVNRAKFRKIIQDSMASSGYGLHETAESAKQAIRMFQGTPGGGIDVLPEMLAAATTEARLKDKTTPQDAMRAYIGLAHMTKQYGTEAIKKLAPAFAFLSIANPSSLTSMERAAGYAVPLLQSGLEIDPIQTLLMGTALTRAGATNTKSGTWLREMAIRAMPGTSMMSKFAYKKHEAALKELGLADEKGKPTWFTEGKPDLMKMLDIGGTAAAKIPLTRRAAIERSLFGAQGGGGFALLADPAVNEQVKNLRQTMESPEWKNQYGGFMEAYKGGSTVQQARTGMAEFNITMMELGKSLLPAVNAALKDFKSMLEGIRSILPSGSTMKVGARALEGAAAGAVAGSVIPGIGTIGGAMVGGALGAAEGYMEQQAADAKKQGGRVYERQMENLWAPRLRLGEGSAAAPKIAATTAPLTLNLNIDGKTIAETIGTMLTKFGEFPTQAPAADGMGQHYSGDHNFPDN